MNVLTAYLQIVLENSGGAMKVKVIEFDSNNSYDQIYMPRIVDILESEPLISVRKKSYI